ncbi:MAG: hypothetical protein DRJ31_11095 [Candidatus Methanomethylicota archaeon]|uniref:Shikimate dehydrogenase (NADP(+)) n=1 Tax=Thermoproteota archaeon TaxID=2056631 RepID=A0A497EJ50_9CREN|nr:MAG: hypothetical protein DRJ31_11095 [Candidatus Verstraetearchaeota archaeon]
MMHNAAFKFLGMSQWHYEKLPINPQDFTSQIKYLIQQGYVGINVTTPYKQKIISLFPLDKTTQVIGAVNVVDFRKKCGYNTDIIGFLEDLAFHKVSLQQTKIIVLGTGGVARAAVYGLVQQGTKIGVVSRSKHRAKQMIEELGVEANIFSAEEALRWKAEWMINCTPLGMPPYQNACPWPDSIPFPAGISVYDMIYHPQKTILMQKAEAYGGRALGGLGMLVRQGAAAFSIWTGKKAPLDIMFKAVREYQKRKEK